MRRTEHRWRWNGSDRVGWIIDRNPCPNATFSTKHPTRTGLGTNPDLPGRRRSMLTCQFMEYYNTKSESFSGIETQSLAGIFVFKNMRYVINLLRVSAHRFYLQAYNKYIMYITKQFYYSVCIYYMKNLWNTTVCLWQRWKAKFSEKFNSFLQRCLKARNWHKLNISC